MRRSTGIEAIVDYSIRCAFDNAAVTCMEWGEDGFKVVVTGRLVAHIPAVEIGGFTDNAGDHFDFATTAKTAVW